MDDQDELRQRRDADGVSLPDAIGAHGVDLDRALEARQRARERRGLPRAAHRAGAGAGVAGPAARRRARDLRRRAPPGHLPRPGRARRLDADGQAPRRARGRRRSSSSRSARSPSARATAPSARWAASSRRPGIVTSVVETAECLLDQRHLDAAQARGDARATPRRASRRFAHEENIEVEWERIWKIEPILFDEDADRARRRGGPRGRRHVAPPAERAAARRRRGRRAPGSRR